MTSRPIVWQAVRIVTVVLFIAVAVLGVRAFRSGPTITDAKPEPGEITVTDANRADPRNAVAVRGYVFDDEAGLRLCKGRQSTSPPNCIGPYLIVRGINAGSFNFKTATRKGRKVAWAQDAVALDGTVDGPYIQATGVRR